MIACQAWGACELPELSFCLWHFCKPAAVSWCWFSAGTCPGSTPSPSCSLFQVCWSLNLLPYLWQESFSFPCITLQKQGAWRPEGDGCTLKPQTRGHRLPIQMERRGWLVKATPESQSTRTTQYISPDEKHCSVAQMKEEPPGCAHNREDPLALVVQQEITIQIEPFQSNVARYSIRQKLWFLLGYEVVHAKKEPCKTVGP